MTGNKRYPRSRDGSTWEPIRELLEGVEQTVAEGWYPARRMLMSRFAKAADPQLASWVPEADVEETSSEIALSFALPGVDKSDIRVNVAENELTVSGRRRAGGRATETGSGIRELPTGEFLRRVRLLDEVKPASAKASYRNGVLRVTVARARTRSGRSVKVE